MSWPTETAELADAGFTAIKMRIGRYPLAHERPLYEQVRRDLPASVDLMADGNGGYTSARRVADGPRAGRPRLPLVRGAAHQWDGYVGYERLADAMDIALAGGEMTLSRDARASTSSTAAASTSSSPSR